MGNGRDKTTSSGILIKHEGDGDVSMMRGRDMEFMLRDASIDPRVKKALVALAENNYANSQRVSSMAAMVNQMSDIVMSFVAVAENMKAEVMRKRREISETGEGAEDATSSH